MEQNLSKPWLAHYPTGVDWAMPLQARPVYELLDETAQRFGDRPAFDFLGKHWTWQDIKEQVDCFAGALQKIGVSRGVKVGLFLPNSPYFLISYYAILRAGGTVVNFNPMYAVKELRHQIEDSETDFLITLDLKILCDKVMELSNTRMKQVIFCRFADILSWPKNLLFPLVKRKEVATLPLDTNRLWFHEMVHHAPAPSRVSIDVNEDIAVLQYTGGTTGIPKGAMLTHANVSTNAQQSFAWFSTMSADNNTTLGILPFFHVFAMTVVINLAVIGGREIVALPRFDIKQVLRAIKHRRITCLPAVPAIYNAINHQSRVRPRDLASLQLCIAGGAPLPSEVREAFFKKTGQTVMEGYGLTEASPVVSMNPLVTGNRPGTIGQPLPGTEIEIRDLDTDQPVPLGASGELCVRGPQVMKGYYKKPEETAAVLQNNWLRTGDVAVLDAEGYLTIVDRIKDMIITNGYKIYPRHVEEAIYTHPAVEECIAAGLPDPAKGEITKAWVKLRPGQELTAEQLRTYLTDKLSPLEVPRFIEFRDQPLPKTTIGKLSRKDILAEERLKKP